ncbi:MAG: hypothetical protein SFX73_09760 [Kofleriaceae bacterium]|nr:hypothetical protein [Kofleriaceae bacterium]
MAVWPANFASAAEEAGATQSPNASATSRPLPGFGADASPHPTHAHAQRIVTILVVPASGQAYYV